ncbi:LLM class flavin-dependent oxidoreductase [Cryobacterium glaciale]|uniref:LLM class flavin-dependent oxidoreductase n=1 Tax=Cryobacterium glaciale TaxID=1259145 RepID=UPI00141B7307|nr:LLM class flavin-dependent oxidoreductase [Cryobacterium glaciale]
MNRPLVGVAGVVRTFPGFWEGFGYEVALPARGLGAAQILELSIQAEKDGWTGIWVSEVLSLDAFALLGAISQRTERLRLGTSIVPVTTRSAALLAMTATTMAQLAPGRFALGIGVSTPAIVSVRHDRAVTGPAATSAGVLDVIESALSGLLVEHAGNPAVQNLRIDAPQVRPPVLLAALGPMMIQTAIEHADGLILNLVPLAHAREIAAAAATARPGFQTLLTQRVCFDPTADDLAAIRREVTSYCRVPTYADNLCRLGWDLEAVRVASPTEAAVLLPPGLLEELVIMGTAEECHRRFEEIAAAGVRAIAVPVGSGNTTEKLFAGFKPRFL